MHVFSTEAMYSPLGEYLGIIAKLGPFGNRDFCDSMRRGLKPTWQ